MEFSRNTTGQAGKAAISAPGKHRSQADMPPFPATFKRRIRKEQP